MENDDKDDGYSEEEEEEQCLEGIFQKPCSIDDSMITDASSINVEQMAIRWLAECASSSHITPRQTAVKQLLGVLHSAVSTVEVRKYVEQDVIEEVFLHIQNLAEDKELMVRFSMLATLPKVARVCAEYDSPMVPLKSLIQSEILPIVLKTIAYEDKNCDLNIRNEAFNVRKEGYKALKQLLSEELINQEMIENEVCSIFKDFVSSPRTLSDLFSAGNFIARMASVVGEATTEKLLLPKISEFCSNQLYKSKVREGYVYYLTDLAFYVNSMITENIIIPLFIKLCQDEHWCVRKACARTAVILSCLCLMESRKTVLCRAFLDLLYDEDFEVSSSAFQQLGAFITTFAQPSLTALGSNQSGETILIYNEGSTFKLCERPTVPQLCELDHQKERSVYMFTFPSKSDMSSNTAIESKNEDIYESDSKNDCWSDCVNSYNDYSSNDGEKLSFAINEEDAESHKNLPDKIHTFWGNNFENQPDLVQSCLQKSTESKKSSSNDIKTSENLTEIPDDFNSFQYWRDPIPDFDDCDIPSSARRNLRRRNRKGDLPHKFPRCAPVRTPQRPTESNQSTNCTWNGVILPELDDNVERDAQKMIDNKLKWSENGRAMSTCILKQNVLPPGLLEAFVAMPQVIPVDIKVDCVYSFPAVLLTVGAENWSLLKSAYSELAFDSERKLRLMVASSIHEVAAILGPELATQDLIQIYNTLINDIEEIRVTALNHLSCFVKLLKPQGRCMFLPHLMEFMMTDYTWNWRFRQQLSEQLIEMIDYFAPSDCWKYVSPVAFTLLMDRVSAVRLQALNLITNLIRIVSADINLLRGILAELAEQFAHSTQWARRQSFAFLCSCLMKTPVLPDDMFARDVLPHLLDLSWDSIPNVRIAVARTLSCDVITYPFFSNVFSPHYDVLTQVLKRLCKDKDRDVRYFASLNSSALPPIPSFEKADI